MAPADAWMAWAKVRMVRLARLLCAERGYDLLPSGRPYRTLPGDAGRRRLLTGQVLATDEGVRLALGPHIVAVPPPLDQLLIHLAEDRDGALALGRSTGTSPGSCPALTRAAPAAPANCVRASRPTVCPPGADATAR
ncbi:hypothetical protein [Streptomyces sp. NPDC096132]|uniref:hypothetical protein n=1 Tax=Streptomyces sp. NPDC096132 TaxID=3366075 RepID=UPI0037F99ECD